MSRAGQPFARTLTWISQSQATRGTVRVRDIKVATIPRNQEALFVCDIVATYSGTANILGARLLHTELLTAITFKMANASPPL